VIVIDIPVRSGDEPVRIGIAAETGSGTGFGWEIL
jgi:hypothetical protein